MSHHVYNTVSLIVYTIAFSSVFFRTELCTKNRSKIVVFCVNNVLFGKQKAPPLLRNRMPSSLEAIINKLWLNNPLQTYSKFKILIFHFFNFFFNFSPTKFTSFLLFRLMEKKYQEQLKYLQDEIQNERELVNMQMTRLRSDCEQQVQHMQQINVKCKEQYSQLEQVGIHNFCLFRSFSLSFLVLSSLTVIKIFNHYNSFNLRLLLIYLQYLGTKCTLRECT